MATPTCASFFYVLRRREDAPGSLSVPANGHVGSQARELGSRRARKLNGAAEVTLLGVMIKNIDYITP